MTATPRWGGTRASPMASGSTSTTTSATRASPCLAADMVRPGLVLAARGRTDAGSARARTGAPHEHAGTDAATGAGVRVVALPADLAPRLRHLLGTTGVAAAASRAAEAVAPAVGSSNPSKIDPDATSACAGLFARTRVGAGSACHRDSSGRGRGRGLRHIAQGARTMRGRLDEKRTSISLALVATPAALAKSVDINTADVQALAQVLDGVGPAKAKAIISTSGRPTIQTSTTWAFAWHRQEHYRARPYRISVEEGSTTPRPPRPDSQPMRRRALRPVFCEGSAAARAVGIM